MLLKPLCVLLSLLALSACKPTPIAVPDTATPLLLVQEDLVTVNPGERSSGPMITGSLQAKKRADLRAEVPGVVLQVLKDNGDRVRKGELLVRLDDNSFREALRSSQEAERAAQLSLQQAQRQLARIESLFSGGAISTQAKEDAQLRRDAAQSELAAAKARVAQDSQQLSRTQVLAPFDGVVAQRQVSNGDTAQLGKALLQVIDPASVHFEGMVSAEYAAAVAVNQSVNFYLNGAKDRLFTGQVARINPVADANTRQVQVEVSLAAGTLVSVGLFAEGRILLEKAPGLSLPRSSIAQQGDHQYVWKLAAGQIKKVEITTLGRDAFTGDYWLASGLQAGDQVLRHPKGVLKDGAPVTLAATPQPPQAAAAPAPEARTPDAHGQVK
jgi:membrane fusion protein, multidrug efflux system